MDLTYYYNNKERYLSIDGLNVNMVFLKMKNKNEKGYKSRS
ncbi:hypothetical protein ASZ90_018930 [hydrocarbon metagenome]|uniref:Uncharacterized protein n=1 Tax=hydrocarbon metagenome TaxID=938273 RepID=A0A0W8E522_9ZZZZ